MQRACEGIINSEKWAGSISGMKEFKMLMDLQLLINGFKMGGNVEKPADVKGHRIKWHHLNANVDIYF